MASRARGIAGAIREATGYRWVGVYRVGRGEVEILGWSGGGPPAYATFPVTEGLTSSAVTTGRTVVSNDTRNDPRYLTAFSSTRSEIIVPILHPRTQAVVGTIDVESDRTNAFDDEDRQALERCARAMAALYVE
jgi:GAF domain-containing protein